MAETEERNVDDVKDAARDMERTAGEMSERGEKLDSQIGEAKETWQHAKDDSSVPTASSDWEDAEPDEDDDGGDASGFDDPEDLDDEDDDDLDDEDE